MCTTGNSVYPGVSQARYKDMEIWIPPNSIFNIALYMPVNLNGPFNLTHQT